MEVKKTIFYDVSGRDDEIYMQHFKSDGFVQDWLHFHVKYELTLVLCGNSEIISEGRVYACQKPHFRLHKPFSFHTANAHKGTTYDCYVFYFTEAALSSPIRKADLRRLFRDDISIIELDGDTLECARALAEITLLETCDGMRKIVLSGMLTLAEDRLEQNCRLSSTSQPLGYLSDVLTYINEHFAEKITSAELARKYYVSEQKLNMDFKRLLGDTLHHYHMTVRISQCAMLIARGMPPLAASVECGFVDECHFSKTFKSRIGLTPYQFSKQVASQIEYHGDYDEKDTKI